MERTKVPEREHVTPSRGASDPRRDFGSNASNVDDLLHDATASSLEEISLLSDEPARDPLAGLSSSQTRPTCRGTLEGFLPGESRHKTVAKQAFGNITDPRFEKPRGSWREQQDDMSARVHGAVQEPDAKLMNDVFVAQIMADKDIMKTSAGFAARMSRTYGPGGTRAEQIEGHRPEMKHMWPDQDLSGTKNQDYRGWESLIGSEIGGRLGGLCGGHGDALSEGIGANGDTLDALALKEGDYTLEEASYIVRAMGQLRDAMKAEKDDGGLIREWIGDYEEGAEGYPVEPKNRIRVGGRPKSADGANRDDPTSHDRSRGLSRWAQPIGTWVNQGTRPYAVENRVDGEPESFDYLQGTSGTTLDMLNFFMAHDEDKDTTAKLMQGFYANWHAVAPDGNAHSQSESMGTMMQYLYGANLQAPIMTPIHGQADVDSMTGEDGEGRARYANPLTDEAPGYLDLQRRGH